MKIIGFIYRDGKAEMVLKGDSCLLNGRKPLFLPEDCHELGATPCLILRVSRLGKSIAVQFANRYYDATAPGFDFVDLDKQRTAIEHGTPWTEAIDFDYSLSLGEWTTDDGQWTMDDLLLSPEEAIVRASKVMTIRQGDLIYIQAKQAPRVVEKEEVLRIELDGKELLYCKIK